MFYDVTDQFHISRGRRKNNSACKKVFDSILVKVDLHSNHSKVFHGQKSLLMLEVEHGASADIIGLLSFELSCGHILINVKNRVYIQVL